MPAEHRFDPTWLDVVATQLGRSSAAALEASHELLAHYSDVGEPATQDAVDTLVNRTAGALGALADRLAHTSGSLQEAGQRAASMQEVVSRATASRTTATHGVGTGGSSVRANMRDQGA